MRKAITRAIRDERPCGFNNDEMNESFDDLVNWAVPERDWDYATACKK
ncbi:MAG: hypothetical protein K2P94_18450 [Rhodospirillaceae bacterium]|nr:hypothetical protein [Rhodospirillaceae bacterium]